MGQVEIELTENKLAIIDSDDLELIRGYRWKAVRNKDRWYAIAYKRRGANVTRIWMHRLIMGVQGQDYKNTMIDHRNHDCLDNRKQNLRICSNSENQRNSRPHKDGALGTKGIYWRESRKRYEIRVSINGKRIYLGFAKSLEAAKRIYDEKAPQIYKQFAWTHGGTNE